MEGDGLDRIYRKSSIFRMRSDDMDRGRVRENARKNIERMLTVSNESKNAPF